MMTLAEATKWAGTRYALAKRLGIAPAAVYQWRGKVPKLREYEIREMMAKDRAK